MKMAIERMRGWRLREAPFPFQQTYQTPLPDLNCFVSTLLSPFLFRELVIKIETVVFEPEEVIKFLSSYGINKKDEPWLDGQTITAETNEEAASLLEALLGDWIDFAGFPSLSTFAIYADHDEFITVFTQTPVLLNALRLSMKQANFREIEDWQWTAPHSSGVIAQG